MTDPINCEPKARQNDLTADGSQQALIAAQSKLIDDQARTIARLMGMNADLMKLVSHLEVCTRIDSRLLGAEALGHASH